MAELVLVLGGTRSGKSAVAEQLLQDAEAAGMARGVVYVATARPGGDDAELRERIAAHRVRRPAHWTTVEGQGPAAAVAAAPPGAGVLVDGLGLWVAARMEALGLLSPDITATAGAELRKRVDAVLAEGAALAAGAVAHPGGPVVVVAEETGMGVVAADAATRRWVDVHGAVVQALSAAADRAFLVVAGRAIPLPHAATAAGSDRGDCDPVDNHGTPAPACHTGQRGTQAQPLRAHDQPRRSPAPGAATNRVLTAAPHQPEPTTPVTPPSHPVDAAPPPSPQSQAQQPAETHHRLGELRVHGDSMVPEGALDLAVNVHGPRPAEHVRAAVLEAVDRSAAYPDPAVATAALARRHAREPASVLVTAGAAEAFWLLAAAARARSAVVVQPQFTEPEAALRAHGIPVCHVLRRAGAEWALDPAAVGDDADLVVVGNPNNPTGTLDAAESVAALCRPGRLTVVDEAFMDFVPDEAASLAHRGDLPGLVVVRSVTKLWGLAGVRAGYLLGPPGVVARLRALRQPWSVSSPALAAVTVCAGDNAYRRAVAGRVATQRAALLRTLREIPGVTAWDAAANFVLVRVPGGLAVHAALLDRGIAVRRCTFPGLSADHLRIAVADEAATRRLATALRDVLTAGGRPERPPVSRGPGSVG